MIQNFEILGTDHEVPGVQVRVLGRVHVFPQITAAQMIEGRARYRAGALIQNAFPFLNADQREFLMTGMTPEEWDQTFGPEPGDE